MFRDEASLQPVAPSFRKPMHVLNKERVQTPTEVSVFKSQPFRPLASVHALASFLSVTSCAPEELHQRYAP
eukprot:6186707-Pleurochrysis_carterae.AAC.6